MGIKNNLITTNISYKKYNNAANITYYLPIDRYDKGALWKWIHLVYISS